MGELALGEHVGYVLMYFSTTDVQNNMIARLIATSMLAQPTTGNRMARPTSNHIQRATAWL